MNTRTPLRQAPIDLGCRGFTLFEVIVALAILVLLAGALFSTVRATMVATATLDQTQRSRQQIFSFLELCQQNFNALPEQATIVWNTNNETGLTTSEVDLRLAPYAFNWGDTESFYGEISICSHAAADGTLTLGIEDRTIDTQTGLVLPNPLWLPLLSNLSSVTWQFYDTNTSQWQTYWNNNTRHPSMISLDLQFVGETRTWSQIFWLPTLSAPPAVQLTSSSTTTTNNTNTSTTGGKTSGNTSSTVGGFGSSNGSGTNTGGFGGSNGGGTNTGGFGGSNGGGSNTGGNGRGGVLPINPGPPPTH